MIGMKSNWEAPSSFLEAHREHPLIPGNLFSSFFHEGYLLHPVQIPLIIERPYKEHYRAEHRGQRQK